MIIFYQYGTKTKPVCWNGEIECPTCGAKHHSHLCKRIFTFSIYWIPLIKFTTKRVVLCDNCSNYEKIKRKDFRQRKAVFQEAFERQQIPEEIVAQDFAPSSTHLGWKLAAMILVLLLSVFALIGWGSILADTYARGWGLDMLIGTPAIFAFVAIVSLLSIRSFRRAWAWGQYHKRCFPKIKGKIKEDE